MTAPWLYIPLQFKEPKKRSRKKSIRIIDDSAEIHRFVRDSFGTDSLIPVRNQKRKRINRRYRRTLSKSFDETVPSEESRRDGILGDETEIRGRCKGRKYRPQVKEIKVKVVIYHLNRWIKEIWFIVIEGSLQC